MPYPEIMIHGMRQELANLGIEETKTPEQVKEAVDIIGQAFETEASGGITLENIESYAATGVDFVSTGAVIHQAKSLDLSLKAILQ